MKTKDFIIIAQKLIKTNLFNVLKKGKHGNLGSTHIGETDAQNTKLWREYRTLVNIVIFKTAEETNKILLDYNITEFIAKPTKSKTMCRLHINPSQTN